MENSNPIEQPTVGDVNQILDSVFPNEGMIGAAMSDVNPFKAEQDAIQAQNEAEQKAAERKSAVLDTVIAAVRIDRFKAKKAAKFDPSVIGSTFANILMEQLPDGSASPSDQTRHKLSIAMGYTHTENTENVAVCAVKLPVGVTMQQFEKALRELVGEDNFVTKDYFRTGNPDMRTQFRQAVDSIRYLNTYSECGGAASAPPYLEFKEKALQIVQNEEESLA